MSPSDPISVDLSGIIHLPAASTDTDGLVELASTVETQEGVDGTTAITPAAAAATYIPIDDFTAKGDILTATAPATLAALPAGEDGHILTACSVTPTGLYWAALPSPPPPAIPCACITGKGALVTGTAPDSPVAFPVGDNGQVLTACSTAPSGLCWATSQSSGIPCSAITGKGSILAGSATATPVALPVGSNGQVLYANSACTTGLEWSNVGKTASAVANSGIIALTMDNLRVCFNSTGNRTWAFSTVSGTCTAIAQTTCATTTAMATQCKVASLNPTTFTELGWNFTQGASCATYMICLGPLGNPNAIYCFVGMVGCNFATNFFNLTRLY